MNAKQKKSFSLFIIAIVCIKNFSNFRHYFSWISAGSSLHRPGKAKRTWFYLIVICCSTLDSEANYNENEISLNYRRVLLIKYFFLKKLLLKIHSIFPDKTLVLWMFIGFIYDEWKIVTATQYFVTKYFNFHKFKFCGLTVNSSVIQGAGHCHWGSFVLYTECSLKKGIHKRVGWNLPWINGFYNYK